MQRWEVCSLRWVISVWESVSFLKSVKWVRLRKLRFSRQRSRKEPWVSMVSSAPDFSRNWERSLESCVALGLLIEKIFLLLEVSMFLIQLDEPVNFLQL